MLSSTVVLTTLWLSIRISLMATALNLPIALMLVYATRHDFRGKNILEGVINLPLVMPPVTTGYILHFLPFPFLPFCKPLSSFT